MRGLLGAGAVCVNPYPAAPPAESRHDPRWEEVIGTEGRTKALGLALKSPELIIVLAYIINRPAPMPLSCFLRCEGEVGEIGSLLRGAFCPEDEKLASILSGVRAVCLAGLEMQRSAGLVLLALIGEVALSHIERLGHAFVEMCRNDRAGAHTDVQHDRPQRVIRVADPQRNVALTGERETIRLELIVEYFLIDHDTVSCASKSPPADLISEAARLFLELTKRLPLPKKRGPRCETEKFKPSEYAFKFNRSHAKKIGLFHVTC